MIGSKFMMWYADQDAMGGKRFFESIEISFVMTLSGQYEWLGRHRCDEWMIAREETMVMESEKMGLDPSQTQYYEGDGLPNSSNIP